MTKMTDVQIQAALDEIEPMVREKIADLHQSSGVQVHFQSHSEPCIFASLKGDCFLIRGSTVFEAFQKAHEALNAMPPIEEQHRKTFMKDMAKLIEKGREIGIDAAFVNPLEVLMKELSENVITDQSEAKDG